MILNLNQEKSVKNHIRYWMLLIYKMIFILI